jgi:tetratricopeptide (TPR) repeat protein
MPHDFNRFERSANRLKELGRWQDALEIYIFMADGDPSLDAGYLGTRIAECYEALGRMREAKYWHGRAVEENPGVRLSSEEALRRIGELPVEHLLIVD